LAGLDIGWENGVKYVYPSFAKYECVCDDDASRDGVIVVITDIAQLIHARLFRPQRPFAFCVLRRVHFHIASLSFLEMLMIPNLKLRWRVKLTRYPHRLVQAQRVHHLTDIDAGAQLCLLHK